MAVERRAEVIRFQENRTTRKEEESVGKNKTV
jgi:hypothetical protein